MKHIVTIVAVLFTVNAASAQITLNESTIQALIGKRLVSIDFEASDTTGTWALYNQAGTNQTWDITSFGWAQVDTFSSDFLSSIAGTAGENDPDFANANFVQTSTEIEEGTFASYNFFDGTGVYEMGQVFITNDMDPDTSKSLYTPVSLDIPFPFTFGTTVSDSTTHNVFLADTVAFTDVVAKDGEVDGWGTLVTPNGSFDVLRYKSEERNYAFGFVTVSMYVEWWGPTGVIFQISMEESLFGPPIVDIQYATTDVVEITAIDEDQFDLPANFALQQNYPNPFNPSTMIPFELKESASVKLVVFDMLGRQIETLVNGTLPVGVHQVEWTPTSLTGGMYVVQIDVNGRTQARTMTLLK